MDEGFYHRKSQAGATRTLPMKILNQRQYHIVGGIAEIGVTIKDLKDARVVIPTATPFNLSIGQ